MHVARSCLILALLASVIGRPQNSTNQLDARALFYAEKSDQDQLPPVPKAQPRPQAKSAGSKGSVNIGPAPKSVNAGVLPTRSPVVPAVQHLGLTYNVILVDPRTRNVRPSDPDREFQSGECVAFEFEANRTGYLYVLEQGSSGKWKPLIPSAQAPAESNIVRSMTKQRVPNNYCFEIENPPGVERIFIVLSRNSEDIYQLDRLIRSGAENHAAPTQNQGAPVLTAGNLDKQIEAMPASREIKMTKLSAPEGDEPANSVFVVSEVVSDRVITEIHLSHR